MMIISRRDELISSTNKIGQGLSAAPPSAVVAKNDVAKRRGR